jgi:hypothetical protein
MSDRKRLRIGKMGLSNFYRLSSQPDSGDYSDDSNDSDDLASGMNLNGVPRSTISIFGSFSENQPSPSSMCAQQLDDENDLENGLNQN